MFQLKLADTDVSSGSVALSWCLDNELIKNLAKEGTDDPQVVIVIYPEVKDKNGSHNNLKEVRKVVPLKDLMTYVELKVAGKNRIVGFVYHASRSATKSRFLYKTERAWETTIIDSNGDPFPASYYSYTDNRLSQLSIDVPAGIFAPEPAQWEKNLVNHYFRDKVVDQCSFRRRRIFAYSLQPIMALLFIFLTIIILIAGLLTGARKWSIKYLFHPLIYNGVGT